MIMPKLQITKEPVYHLRIQSIGVDGSHIKIAKTVFTRSNESSRKLIEIHGLGLHYKDKKRNIERHQASNWQDLRKLNYLPQSKKTSVGMETPTEEIDAQKSARRHS